MTGVFQRALGPARDDRFESGVPVADPLLGPVSACDGWVTVEFEPVSGLPETDAPASPGPN